MVYNIPKNTTVPSTGIFIQHKDTSKFMWFNPTEQYYQEERCNIDIPAKLLTSLLDNATQVYNFHNLYLSGWGYPKMFKNFKRDVDTNTIPSDGVIRRGRKQKAVGNEVVIDPGKVVGTIKEGSVTIVTDEGKERLEKVRQERIAEFEKKSSSKKAKEKKEQQKKERIEKVLKSDEKQ